MARKGYGMKLEPKDADVIAHLCIQTVAIIEGWCGDAHASVKLVEDEYFPSAEFKRELKKLLKASGLL